MTDETTNGAAGEGAPLRLALLLPRLEARDGEASGDLVRAIAAVIGPRNYSKPDFERDWSTATLEECRNALVFAWRLDRWTSNEWGPSGLVHLIEAGTIAPLVRRFVALKSCPSCSSPDVLRILYGEPNAEGAAMVARGEVVLGGCLLGEESPTWECMACRQMFGRLGDERPEMFRWKERSDG